MIGVNFVVRRDFFFFLSNHLSLQLLGGEGLCCRWTQFDVKSKFRQHIAYLVPAFKFMCMFRSLFHCFIVLIIVTLIHKHKSYPILSAYKPVAQSAPLIVIAVYMLYIVPEMSF